MPFLPVLRHRLLLLLLLIAPTIGLFAPLGFAPILGLAGLVCLPDLRLRHLRQLPFPALLIVTLAWAAVSLTWTPAPLAAAKGLLRTSGVLLTGTALLLHVETEDAAGRHRLLTVFALGLALSALPMLWICGQYRVGQLLGWGMPHEVSLAGTRLDRGITFITLGLFPVLAVFWHWGCRKRALGLALLILLSISISLSLASKIALICGLLILVCGWLLSHRLAIGASALAMLLLMVATPAMVSQLPAAETAISMNWIPLSSVHRLVIWQFASQQIDERPLLGWGYESSRELGEKHIFHLDGGPGRSLEGEVLPLHPHNFALQIRMELGVVGALLFTAILAAVMIEAFRRHNSATAAVACGSFLVSLVSYGIWQSWWLSCLWLLACLCRLAERDAGGASC